MIEAARVGNEEILRLLLSWENPQVKVDDTNDFGWTPLVEACRNQRYLVAEMLLEYGSDPKHEDLVID